MTDSEIDVVAINSIEHLGRDNDHNVFKAEVGTGKPFALAFGDTVSAKFMMHLIDAPDRCSKERR